MEKLGRENGAVRIEDKTYQPGVFPHSTGPSEKQFICRVQSAESTSLFEVGPHACGSVLPQELLACAQAAMIVDGRPGGSHWRVSSASPARDNH